MQKERMEKKMTNTQPFTIPDFPAPIINLRGYKDITNRNVAPDFKVIHVTWSSLLGKSNQELITLALSNSSKFISFVKQTREDFKVNYMNFSKYPKMNENDWE